MTRPERVEGETAPVSPFPLAELLFCCSLLTIFVWSIFPRGSSSRDSAVAFADAHNLRQHGRWLQLHIERSGALPREGGHRFVMSSWTEQLFDHDEEKLDYYFTPDSQDPHWREVRQMMERGEDPWPDIDSVTSDDTHYCGRALEHLDSATQSAAEAWMADDNDGVWNLRDGTVNVLFHGANVRTYSYQDLREQFGLGGLDRANPVQTWGPDSPIPACRKLAR